MEKVSVTPPAETILIVDDNEDARYALERIVAHNGYKVIGVSSGREAIDRARVAKPSLILLDLMMPGMDGYEVTGILKSDPELRYTPIILVTARDSLEDVIAGLDAGADDYIVKPFKSEELLARLRAALRLRNTYFDLRDTKAKNNRLVAAMTESFDSGAMIGSSPAMKKIFTLLERVSNANAPVLITGSSGTGKELAARAIHFNSNRRAEPFIARNCAAFSEHLLESELFGHVKGAFTSAIRDQKGIFEAADGGTLFLDEIGEMTLTLQPKLLRVLQEGTFTPVGSTSERKVDVRVVAATNRDLPKLVQEGKFREDLYYRLNVVAISLPTLAERKEDISTLAEFFLARATKGLSKKVLLPEVTNALLAYGWPGNVRELQNEIERLVILSGPDEEIGMDLVSERIQNSTPTTGAVQKTSAEEGSLKSAIDAIEQKMIREALIQTGGNKSDAARRLGISRSNFLAKLQSYGIDTAKSEES